MKQILEPLSEEERLHVGRANKGGVLKALKNLEENEDNQDAIGKIVEMLEPHYDTTPQDFETEDNRASDKDYR